MSEWPPTYISIDPNPDAELKYSTYDGPVTVHWYTARQVFESMQEQIARNMAEAVDCAILAGQTDDTITQHPPPSVKWYVRLGRAVSWWWYDVRVWICVHALGLDPYGEWEDDN